MQVCDAMHRYLDCNAYVTRQIAYAHVCINISAACLRKILTNKKRERGEREVERDTERNRIGRNRKQVRHQTEAETTNR